MFFERGRFVRDGKDQIALRYNYNNFPLSRGAALLTRFHARGYAACSSNMLKITTRSSTGLTRSARPASGYARQLHAE